MLAGQERFEDFAIVPTTAGSADGYPWYWCNQKPAFAWAFIFVVSYLLHAFNGVLRTLLHSQLGASCGLMQ